MRIDRGRNRSVRGQDDDACVRMRLARFADDVHAVELPGHAKVGDEKIELLFVESPHRSITAGRFGEMVAIGGERLDEELANPRLVVNDENVGH